MEIKEPLLCYCTRTTAEKILDLIEQGKNSLEEIINTTGATTGCGGCDYEVAKLVEHELNKKEYLS
ncbi:MAG: (2Fe-2S)-binding protein [Methylococcaceae bacterium]